MATHDDKKKAERYIIKAEELTRSSTAALLVAAGLLVASYFTNTSGWVGVCVIAMGLLALGAGELYLRSARRLMDRQYRR